MSNIRYFVFDLGNVILDLDFERAQAAFHALVGQKREEIHHRLTKEQVYDKFETDEINEAAFLQIMQDYAPVPISKEAIEDAWNKMLLSIPKERIEFLRALSKKYPIYLLSNSNSIHLRWINNYLRNTHQIESIDHFIFEKAYFSQKINLRKPDPKIYQHLLADAQLLPQHTLFIDDLEINTQAAEKEGIQCLHLKPGMRIEEELKKYL